MIGMGFADTRYACKRAQDTQLTAGWDMAPDTQEKGLISAIVLRLANVVGIWGKGGRRAMAPGAERTYRTANLHVLFGRRTTRVGHFAQTHA